MTNQIYFVYAMICSVYNIIMNNSNKFCHAMICSMYNIIFTTQIYFDMQWFVISIT